MTQPPHSQENTQTETTPTQMLAHYHQRANEFYQAGNYPQALKELKQALRYASSENDLEVIEVNIKTISQMLQEEENPPMDVNVENSADQYTEDAAPVQAIYQNKLLLLAILVGVICFTPIIMKCIEIFTHHPEQTESSQVANKPASPTIQQEAVTPVVQPVQTTIVEALVMGSGVNMREQPSTQAKPLTRLSMNEKVQVLADKTVSADGYTWSKIKTSAGLEGFVSASFLQAQTTPTAPVVENVPAAVTENIPAGTETVQATNPAETSANLQTPTSNAALKKVNAAGVSLRSGPSVTQALITTLPAETEIEVLQSASVTADGLTWSQIKTSQGTIGWMASKFIN
jgi:SH3-like domain-containing protein